MRRRGWTSEAGFTLTEALFVVALMGVLVALALPAYRNVIMERRVQNTTREIAALLRVAQQAAVAKSAEARCVAVSFGDTRVQVRVVTDRDCTSASGAVLMSSQEYPTGVTVDPSGDTLAFLPSGVPDPTCARDNCTAFRVKVAGGGHTRYVCVNAAGLVTVPPAGGQCQ